MGQEEVFLVVLGLFYKFVEKKIFEELKGYNMLNIL